MTTLARAGAVAWGLVALVLVAELACRWGAPDPARRWTPADADTHLDEVGGVPVWTHVEPDADRRAAVGCDLDGAWRVMLLGSSMLSGVDLDADDVLSAQLPGALAAASPDARACVRDLAVSGYALPQSLAVGRAHLAELRPHLVVLQMYGAMLRDPVRVGDGILLVERLPDGHAAPVLPVPVPTAWLGWWVEHSALVRAWARTPVRRESLFDLGPFHDDLDAFVDDVHALGGQVVGIVPADFDAPLEAQPAGLVAEADRWSAWADGAGVPVVRLWEVLPSDVPAETFALRGHYLSAEGHAWLARYLVDTHGPARESGSF